VTTNNFTMLKVIEVMILMTSHLHVHILGAVDLPLTCAQISDQDNIGLECWHADLPPNDSRAAFAESRLRCYNLVLDSLTVFEELSSQRPTNSAPSVSGDPEVVRSHAYELAFSSEDEMFHSTMYDWLISRNLADDLLEVCGVKLLSE
jgi:nuclear pore complex protein Nup155